MGFRKDQVGEGFVYAVRSANSANCNEIKVGLTIDPESRRRELSGTASAFPFLFERVWAVTNMALAEHIAHTMLQEHRINEDREHFYIVPLHIHEAVFGNLWYEPSDDELDACLAALLDRIERMFTSQGGPLRWYPVACYSLPAYSRGRIAWQRGRPGATPLEPLFSEERLGAWDI